MRYDYDKTNSEDLQDNIMNWMIKIILLLKIIINSQILFEICLFLISDRL